MHLSIIMVEWHVDHRVYQQPVAHYVHSPNIGSRGIASSADGQHNDGTNTTHDSDDKDDDDAVSVLRIVASQGIEVNSVGGVYASKGVHPK